jgi:PAS domain S-box-containing protein
MMLGIDELPVVTSAAFGAAARAPADAVHEDFLKLAEASPAMIWMADNEGLCTFANQSWLDFRGRTLDQEIGTGWMEGIHGEDFHRAMRAYWLAFKGHRPLRIEYRIRCRDDAYYEVERLGSPWPGPDRDARGYLGCITVIRAASDQAIEAREQLARLSARERQVMELIALGYSTKETSARLGISYKTADSHRTHVLKKLGVHETASLVRFAIRAGVITP